MTIEEKLKQMIIDEYGSIRAFTMQKGLTYANVDSILRRGIKNATWTSVKKLCHALNISANDLAYEKIVPIEAPEQPPAAMDLEQIIKQLKLSIDNYSEVSLDGQNMSPFEVQTILDTVDLGIDLVRRNRKRAETDSRFSAYYYELNGVNKNDK